MAWDDLPGADASDLARDPDYWIRGYFKESHRKDNTCYRRDLDEVRRRDLALYALGEVRGRKVLDVACGSGLYALLLARMGAEVSGQDISASSVQLAHDALARHHLRGDLKVGDAMEILFADDSFDGVISGDFVEHITTSQKARFFQEVNRVLRPGGVFVVKTPNLTYLKTVVWAKRALAALRLRNPVAIHVEHTRDNPDREHHGLATHAILRGLLVDAMFHEPVFVHQPLSKKPLPRFLQYTLPRVPLVWPAFNRDLIFAARKSIGLGLFP
jgi:2-polyprenyl-3-methyl-5-hydroxy-6-metoxy-1,4-benzoquinol methylase